MKKYRNLALLPVTFFVVGCSNPGESLPKLEPSHLVNVANEYIQNNKNFVDNSRKPKFHLSPEIGWMNDPNGFSEFDGKYHLFYQYYPYDAVWGSMHWGHQTTTDYVKWEHQPVALAPDEEYDTVGCFSGTAITEGDKHYLAYTSVIDGAQNQALAYSYDGVVYNKIENNPILDGDDLPIGFSNADFRDPKIFKRDGVYYMLVGNRDNAGNKQIICFKSNNIESGWEYFGVTYSRTNVGGIFECPDLIQIDGKDVLIASPQRIARSHDYEYQNDDSCVYKIGNFSPVNGKFRYTGGDDLEEFDKGFSFYAPQTMTTSDGRHILTAWMKSWSETNITRTDGWAGSMVLPRELTIVDNHIYQKPVRELENYFINNTTNEDLTLNNETVDLPTFAGTSSSIELEIDISNNPSKAGIEIMKDGRFAVKIYYDASHDAIVFDRSSSASILSGVRYAKVEPIDGKIKLQIIQDVSSVEVFINDGYYTMTGNIFTSEEYKNVSLFSEGNASFTNLEYNEIKV